jgi:hypothetical protein
LPLPYCKLNAVFPAGQPPLEKGGSGQGDEGGHKEQKQTIPNS